MERELARARRTDQSLVLAFIDVDHLKVINDWHGHAAGDRTLVEVTTSIRAKLRSYDLVMRYGGDEFVCSGSGLIMDDGKEQRTFVSAALAEAPEQDVGIGWVCGTEIGRLA